MANAGLPTPANHAILGPADFSPAAEAVGFPAVLKPISGGASLGVVRVDSLQELRRCALPQLALGSEEKPLGEMTKSLI